MHTDYMRYKFHALSEAAQREDEDKSHYFISTNRIQTGRTQQHSNKRCLWTSSPLTCFTSIGLNIFCLDPVYTNKVFTFILVFPVCGHSLRSDFVVATRDLDLRLQEGPTDKRGTVWTRWETYGLKKFRGSLFLLKNVNCLASMPYGFWPVSM